MSRSWSSTLNSHSKANTISYRMRKSGKPGDPFWSPRGTSCDPDITKIGGRPGLGPTSTLSSARTRSIPAYVFHFISFFPFLSFVFSFLPRGAFPFLQPGSLNCNCKRLPDRRRGGPHARSAERIRIRIRHCALRTMHLTFIGVLDFNTCCFNLVRRYKAHSRESIPPPCFRFSHSSGGTADMSNHR